MSFWTAIKRYFGHHPDYKPWTTIRHEDFPFDYVDGVHDGIPVRGFVVPANIAAHYEAGGTWPRVPADMRNQVEGFWM